MSERKVASPPEDRKMREKLRKSLLDIGKNSGLP